MVPNRQIVKRILKLYEKAKNSPNNIYFKELCRLAEKAGFQQRKQQSGTSHRIYTHPKLRKEKPLSFQSDGGKAKPYQVRQLLDLIDAYGLLEE
jgi:predicted RNA binding protein YcfA (HicA-like mRNA interferase family)